MFQMRENSVRPPNTGLYITLGLHSGGLPQGTASRWFSIVEKVANSYRMKLLYPSVKIRSQGTYLSRLSHLCNNSACTVAFLDRLDPELVFELGWIMARGKPVMLFRTEEAEIDVKKFFGEPSEAGLDGDAFGKLKNPKIRGSFPRDYPVFKKVVTFDPSDPKDLEKKAKTNFENYIGDIEGEIKRLVVPVAVDEDFRADYWLILGKMIEHNTGGELMTGTYIEELMDHIIGLARDKFIGLPSEFFETSAESFSYLVERKGGEEPGRVDDFRRLAVKGFRDGLEDRDPRSEPYLYSIAKERLGLSLLKLAEVEDREKNVELAGREFAQGLSALNPAEFPVNYSRLLLNLGETFLLMSEFSGGEEHKKKAGKAFEEVLSLLPDEDYPDDCARARKGLKTLS
jgi:hypothetical protein